MDSPPREYSDSWTLYGILAPVLSLQNPIIANDQPARRGLGFRALDSP
ncbi:hypothetical protein BO068_005265 [Escherichia coli]|nr:hypothetical protein [Escherichia coli]